MAAASYQLFANYHAGKLIQEIDSLLHMLAFGGGNVPLGYRLVWSTGRLHSTDFFLGLTGARIKWPNTIVEHEQPVQEWHGNWLEAQSGWIHGLHWCQMHKYGDELWEYFRLAERKASEFQ